MADLPVSVQGGVVEGGVSSAVHTIHIGASPDAVKNRKGLLGLNNMQQSNTYSSFLYSNIKNHLVQPQMDCTTWHYLFNQN